MLCGDFTLVDLSVLCASIHGLNGARTGQPYTIMAYKPYDKKVFLEETRASCPPSPPRTA